MVRAQGTRQARCACAVCKGAMAYKGVQVFAGVRQRGNRPTSNGTGTNVFLGGGGGGGGCGERQCGWCSARFGPEQNTPGASTRYNWEEHKDNVAYHNSGML